MATLPGLGVWQGGGGGVCSPRVSVSAQEKIREPLWAKPMMPPAAGLKHKQPLNIQPEQHA